MWRGGSNYKVYPFEYVTTWWRGASDYLPCSSAFGDKRLVDRAASSSREAPSPSKVRSPLLSPFRAATHASEWPSSLFLDSWLRFRHAALSPSVLADLSARTSSLSFGELATGWSGSLCAPFLQTDRSGGRLGVAATLPAACIGRFSPPKRCLSVFLGSTVWYD